MNEVSLYRIPVEVTFSAKKAMSFYAALDFLDADEIRCRRNYITYSSSRSTMQ